MIEVWNKVDALDPARAETVAAIAARDPRVHVISALTGQGVPALLDAVAADLAEPVEDETLHLRFDQGRERAWLFDHKLVRAEHATDDGLRRRRPLDRTRAEPVPAL